MTLVGVMTDEHHQAPEQPTWQALLEEVAELRRRAGRIEFRAIELVRSTGVTWEDIGDALNISRQAARQRFGEPRQRRRRHDAS